MSQVRITVKPLGLITFAVVGVVLVAVFIAVLNRPPSSSREASNANGSVGSAPVGSPPPATAAPVDPNAKDAEGMTKAERDEKALLAQLDQKTDQARDWLFIGPLPTGIAIQDVANNQTDQEKMNHIINTSYLPGEAKYQGKDGATVTVGDKKFVWHKVHGSTFDFKRIFTSPETPVTSLFNVVVYGYTIIESEKTENKPFRFRSDDGAVIWVNGKQVYKSTAIRGLLDEDTVKLPLRTGKNTILVKVGQGNGGWGMLLQAVE